jgi:hypothetical protein
MRANKYAHSLLAFLLFAVLAPAAEIRGVIIKADGDKKELTVEGRGRGARGITFHFVLNKDTQILVGEEAGRIVDLKPGRRALIAYEVQGGERVALLVTLHGAPAAGVAAMPLAADPNAVSGTLRRVARTDREIVVISPGDKAGAETETTFQVPEQTKITREQKAIPFDDLKEGDQVAVTPEKKNGKQVAKAIQVGPPGKADAAPDRMKKVERVLQILKLVDGYVQMLPQRQ